MKKKFDIYEFLKNRPLSWSAISSFDYNPQQWYDSYILGKRTSSKEMEFGSKIGKMIEKNPAYLPQIVRHAKMEHPFRVVFDKRIPLVGFADTFCNKTHKKLSEFKTGKKPWDQKRVDDHGQLTMYCLMNYITMKINPEDVDITLVWMPTQDNGDFSISFIEPIEENIKVFKTKRTMKDILAFGSRIKRTVEEMEKYVNSQI